jgi:hypothetical protein
MLHRCGVVSYLAALAPGGEKLEKRKWQLLDNKRNPGCLYRRALW